jgi:hypothetical protein
MNKLFHISADHPVAAYAFTREPVRVRQDVKGYYADGRLGMSKTYKTPEAAAMAMFWDNGCTNVRIVEAPPTTRLIQNDPTDGRVS